MNKKAVVTVIIPVFNREKTIVSCLESVKNQTAINLIKEIIIINDGSTDNTVGKIKKFKEENKEISIKIFNQENKGVSSARNLGMKNSTGKYIAFLDSDDIWLPEKIQKQIDIMNENNQIDLLGCATDERDLTVMFKKIKKLHKVSIKELCIKTFPVTPTIILKKELVEKVGFFDENQKYAEDTNYFQKICADFNYYYLPEYLVDIGMGKPAYGSSGLSANLKEMHKGTNKNIKELRKNKKITNNFYIIMRFFYWLKYLRRIIITKSRKIIK